MTDAGDLLRVTEFRVKLYPHDYVSARKFYEQELRFPVIKEWDKAPNDKGVMFNVGGTVLELIVHDDNQAAVQGCDISLEVPDVRVLWKRMKDGGNVVFGLRENEWGDTSFRITDPEGFNITFFTKTKVST